MANATSTAPQFPPGIPYIVGNEAAERFSFYGMRQILYIYLTGLFVHFVSENTLPAETVADAKVRATQITHAFFGGAYMFTLLGATVADRLLGKYRTIFWVSLLYCVGNAVLAIAAHLGVVGDYHHAEILAYAGLCLIAFASGGIKPCVAANVGDQFSKENASLLDIIFQIFYFVINFGSFLSTLLTPWLYHQFGPAIAFGVPGVLMLVATIVFWLGRHRFVQRLPETTVKLGLLDTFATLFLFTPIFVLMWGVLNGWHPLIDLAITIAGLTIGGLLARARYRVQPSASFLAIVGYSVTSRTSADGRGFFAPARRHFGPDAEGAPALLRIALVFLMLCMFWALYDQHASTWVEQARHMNLRFMAPSIVWFWFVLPALLVSVLFSAYWLYRFVTNRKLSRTANLAYLGFLGAWGVAAIIGQLVAGHLEPLDFNPAQSSALNPFFILVLIPVLNAVFFGPRSRKGKPVSHLTKITIGMFLTSISFVGIALIQAYLERNGDGSLHVVWQAIPYLLLTTGEILVSATGLEFAYAQAPASMKSTIMGLFYLTITLGDVFVIFMAPLMKLKFSIFFWTFAGLMAVAAVLFALIAQAYKGKTYAQEA